nr:permease prefix domain 1-containing protein [Sedimentibacter sp.]
MNQIKNYVEAMFSSLPKTQEVVEMKLNILENMEEKFRELLHEGKNGNEAIGIVISQFGSIDELKAELGIDDSINDYNISAINIINIEELKNEYFKFRSKTPFFYAVAVILYILAPLFFVTLEDYNLDFITFYSLIAIATGIFVYHSLKNKYYIRMLGIKKNTDTAYNNPWNDLILILSVTIYLILGFSMHLWHPGWIIFIIAITINIALDHLYKNEIIRKM